MKEDDAPLERPTRTRPPSGLPPGATNFMTADGARRLRAELLRLSDPGCERAAELGRILASAAIVEPPAEPPKGVVFGAKVDVRDPGGRSASYRVVGVDEANWEPGWVSWTSPIGRALLGSEPGQRVTVEEDGESRIFTIVRIDY